jgi:cytochrome c oxidase subunit II
MFNFFDFMPEGATAWAEKIDWINNWITDVSVICTLLITGVMIYFAIRYRNTKYPNPTSKVHHNTLIEIVWTVIPSVVCVYVFYFGFTYYKEMREPPSNSYEIQVTGQKWSWDFKYPNGKRTNKDLVVPINKPVRLVMTSRDVLHSLFLPAMRVKEDIRPGAYSYLWFTPNKLGDFPIFCAEYCGTNHSSMLATLKIVSAEAFEDFLAERKAGDTPELSPAEKGKELFAGKGCNACHSLDGSALVGPSLQGLFKKGSRPITGGTTVTVDENYVRESILNSNAKIAEGFAPAMPSFEGQLSEDDIDNLISYLKTL